MLDFNTDMGNGTDEGAVNAVLVVVDKDNIPMQTFRPPSPSIIQSNDAAAVNNIALPLTALLPLSLVSLPAPSVSPPIFVQHVLPIHPAVISSSGGGLAVPCLDTIVEECSMDMANFSPLERDVHVKVNASAGAVSAVALPPVLDSPVAHAVGRLPVPLDSVAFNLRFIMSSPGFAASPAPNASNSMTDTRHPNSLVSPMPIQTQPKRSKQVYNKSSHLYIFQKRSRQFCKSGFQNNR